MYKRLIILSVIIIAALCGLVWLGYHSVQMWAQGMEGARRGDFADVAEQIRQDVNRKLDEFVEKEEGRAYTDYQYYYVPDNVIGAQQQMPVLRSPLAGKLEHGLAYGQFQIEPDGSIITPNDSLLAMQATDEDSELYAKVQFNRKNVELNLLPALSQDKAGSLYLLEFADKTNAVLAEEVVQKLAKAVQSERGRKQDSKSKVLAQLRGKNYPINSFQNVDQEAQVFSRSRANVKQEFIDNTAGVQPQDASQVAMLNMRAESDESAQAVQSRAVQWDRATRRIESSGYNNYGADFLERQAKDDAALRELAQDIEIQEKKEAEGLTSRKQAEKKPEEQRSSEQALSTEKAALAAGEGRYERAHAGQEAAREETEASQMPRGGGPGVGQETTTSQTEAAPERSMTDVSSSLKGSESKPKAAQRQQAGGPGGDLYAPAEIPAARTQSAPARPSEGISGREEATQRPTEPQPRQQEGWLYDRQDATQQGQRLDAGQDARDMVQVRIEPFASLLVPDANGTESIFGGQVFMLRHVQIEDKHFVQGFQLNEKELIGEVEESARRCMREGMSFELAREPNGGSAYTAILDFGFGELILNLIEVDPYWIARKISELRNWYFNIIIVVLLAVTLGLMSLWHNARAQLRLAQKKDDFISAVSHELRTPLTSIRMYSEMLEKNWVKSKDKVSEYYKNMRAESERLSRLIENVLDFSRIQRGRKKYAFNLGDMNACIADVVEMMRPYATQNGFSIETQLGELGQTAFDSDAVTQIVVNLLDNAVKYARNSEDKTITVRTKSDGQFILIEVEDHGPGVPHRQRRKIFEEFYRLGAEATRETTGTGLGLALVKKFAQAHNGFVEILGARPSGAIFRVGLAAQT